MKKIEIFKQTQILPHELSKVKGGLLLTCEEKRGNFFGIPYKYEAMVLKFDGKLGLTVKM